MFIVYQLLIAPIYSIFTALSLSNYFSAMNDSRFSPVSKAEISQLSVSVSLLVDFEDASNYLDWTVSMIF